MRYNKQGERDRSPQTSFRSAKFVKNFLSKDPYLAEGRIKHVINQQKI